MEMGINSERNGNQSESVGRSIRVLVGNNRSDDQRMSRCGDD